MAQPSERSGTAKAWIKLLMALTVMFLTPLVSLLYGGILWFLWTYHGLGAKFLYFLPTVWHTPTYWEWVGIYWLAQAVRSILKFDKVELK